MKHLRSPSALTQSVYLDIWLRGRGWLEDAVAYQYISRDLGARVIFVANSRGYGTADLSSLVAVQNRGATTKEIKDVYLCTM